MFLQARFDSDLRILTSVLTSFTFLVVYSSSVIAEEDVTTSTTGLQQRVPWTTSTVSGSPEPPLPYVTERAYPNLKFEECVDITSPPGSDRLFVVERGGKLKSFPDQDDIGSADLVVDFAEGIPGVKQFYSLAFHPNFEQNRYCYVCYIKEPNVEDATHVARFVMADTDPPTIDVGTETPLLTWLSGGHNGCCVRFGPDGYLYVSTGDAGVPNPPDPLQTGQDLTDILSSILRIDVDHVEGENNYRIPADNPFIDLDGARGEIWAYGLRNPWRMSFDSKTGDFWVGDVGWELWEMLYRVERGGNYGWAIKEGRASTNPEWPHGPTPIIPPVIDHRHTESSSITDGLTYYGTRLQELNGHHVYGDYDTGKIWGFRYENGTVVDHREIADTTHRIVGFGVVQGDDFVLLDHTAGTLHRLIENPKKDESATFPRKLSDSGLFVSVPQLTPADGVVPYSINAEPWADHATFNRLVAIPGEQSINNETAAWKFPEGSVLVKTLSLEMTTGEPTSRRHVETQILHFDGNLWMPYTYEWNEAQTDATLVEAAGSERIFEVVDADAAGGIRRQAWRFFGRGECRRCHNPWSGPALAFNTPQLSKQHNYAGTTASQLGTFAHIGILNSPVAKETDHVTSPHDTSAELSDRARGYLHVNCGHCHRLHAGGSVLAHMHFDLPLNKTHMIGARPSQGTFGIHGGQVVAPGDPSRSVLLYRISKLGSGRMPRIGSTEVDRAGINLIHDWLAQLPSDAADEESGTETARKLRASEKATLVSLVAVNEAKEQQKLIQQLLSSTTGAMQLLRAVDGDELSADASALTIKNATAHADGSVRDLFERFLSPNQRIKRLGNVIHPEQILSLSGDAVAGRKVFFETNGVACKSCHRIKNEGKTLGPELTAIGKKLNRGQLLESILQPSKQIDPKYVTHLAETVNGRIFTGLLVEKDDTKIVLRDAQDKLKEIAKSDIEQLVPQRQSLMPDLLLRDMTAQQVADLLAYLASLK